MTKTSKTSAKAATDPATALPPFPANAWLEIMTENTQFMADRMQHLMETQASMLACRNPTELFEIQSEFHKTRMAQYADQMKRVYEVMSEATANTADLARVTRSRSYNDVPL